MAEVSIGAFLPSDAPGVASLFRTVYGDSYPSRVFYDPDDLTAANASGRVISFVARAGDGGVVGHVAYVHSAPFARLWEMASGLVLPEYRRLGLFNRLFDEAHAAIQKHPDVDEVMGEPVCNHLASQRNVRRIDHVAHALEVDLMPAQVYAQEGSAPGRVSTLLTFFPVRPRPHAVGLPSVYRDELGYLYADLGRQRTFTWTADTSLPPGETRIATELFAAAQVARFAVHAVGADFAAVAARCTADAAAERVTVFQFWVPLDSPGAGAAVARLRDAGYFLGGLLPRWFDADGLLMQGLGHVPRWDDIALLDDRARNIAALVRSDWQRTGSRLIGTAPPRVDATGDATVAAARAS